MSVKRKSSLRNSPSRDEPPEITESWVTEADQRRGTKLVRRGWPKLLNPRCLMSLRLPPNVIASWKASGPGWQTRMAQVLERSTPRSRRHAG